MFWRFYAILTRNALKPGDLLPFETALAHLLGVGRNSVRKAVKALEVAGIIEAREVAI